MEQDGSNPIRINCVILNFNDGETVARLVHMIYDYDYLEKIVLVDNILPMIPGKSAGLKG